MAERNVLSHLSRLLLRIEAIHSRLKKAQDAFREGEKVRYVPAGYNGWFDSTVSSEEVCNLRNKWLQTMYSKFFCIRSFSYIENGVENEIEDLRKEYEVFKTVVGQFNLATKALTKREGEIVCSWRSVLWR